MPTPFQFSIGSIIACVGAWVIYDSIGKRLLPSNMNIIDIISGSSKNLDDDKDLYPAMTVEETEEVLAALCDAMESKVTSLKMQVQQIAAQFRAQGQQIDMDQMIIHFLKPGFSQALADSESNICGEYDFESCELEHAVSFYSALNSETVIKLSKKLKELGKSCGLTVATSVTAGSGGSTSSTTSGSVVKGNSDDSSSSSSSVKKAKEPLTEARILEVVDMLIPEITDKMEKFIVDFKDKYGSPANNPELQQIFAQGQMMISTQAEQEILLREGVSPDEWMAMIQKLGPTSQAVQMKFMEMQQAGMMLMQKHAIAM